MLIPSRGVQLQLCRASLSRRVNANSQLLVRLEDGETKLIKKGEC